MILILEVTSPPPAKLGGASRQTFQGEGGSIGREHDNSWVLPDPKVSGHHAQISYRNGVYYIEDTSRNGTYLINSSKNRLARGRPYPLTSGDRILIDPYEIRVSITRGDNDAAGRNLVESSDVLLSAGRFDASRPFDMDDPFAPLAIGPVGLEPGAEAIAGQEVDPLELLGLAPAKRAPARKAPNVNDFERDSLLDAHFQPPAVVADPASPPRVDAISIPKDYDPLAPDDFRLLRSFRALRRPSRPDGTPGASAPPDETAPRRHRRSPPARVACGREASQPVRQRPACRDRRRRTRVRGFRGRAGGGRVESRRRDA